MKAIDRRTGQIEALEALQEAARVTESRPGLIRAARAAGVPWNEIAEALHMSVPGVTRMAKVGVKE